MLSFPVALCLTLRSLLPFRSLLLLPWSLWGEEDVTAPSSSSASPSCPALCSTALCSALLSRTLEQPRAADKEAISCLWELGLGPRLTQNEPWEGQAHKSLSLPSEAAWDPARGQRLPTHHGPLHTWQTKRSELRFPTPGSA